jgi:hypothetical protein
MTNSRMILDHSLVLQLNWLLLKTRRGRIASPGTDGLYYASPHSTTIPIVLYQCEGGTSKKKRRYAPPTEAIVERSTVLRKWHSVELANQGASHEQRVRSIPQNGPGNFCLFTSSQAKRT